MQILPVSRLISCASDLEKAYKGNNPVHKAYIQFYVSLVAILKKQSRSDIEDAKVLTGTLLYLVLLIEREGDCSANSTLLRAIKAMLNQTDTHLYSQHERFILLIAVYNYIRGLPEEGRHSLSGITAEDLMSQVEEMIAGLLVQLMQSVKYLFATADISSISQNIQKISTNYLAIQKSRWNFFGKNNIREKQVGFLNYVYVTSAKRFAEAQNQASTQHESVDGIIYMIHMGALLYVAMSALGTSWITSQLATLCLQQLNINNLNEIDNKIKVCWLELLLTHLQREAQFLEPGKNNLAIQTEDMDITYLKTICDEIENYLIQLKSTLPVQSTYASLKQYAVETSYSVTVLTLANQVVIPAMGGLTIDMAAGVLGYAVLGPLGGCVASQVSRLAREKIITDSVGYAFAHLVERMDNLLAKDSPESFQKINFTLDAKGFAELLDRYKQLGTDNDEVQAWGEALLSLGDAFFRPPSQTQTLTQSSTPLRMK